MTAPAANTLSGLDQPPGTNLGAGMDLTTILAAAFGDTDDILARMDWADEEIYQAIERQPAHADILFHSFALLTIRRLGPGMNTEFVFRGHAREVLGRLAKGADTRAATAAEICLAITEVSKVTPINGPAFGLYLRMWLSAFPATPIFDDHAAQLGYYEYLHGSRMDDLEKDIRTRLADPDRVMGAVSCHGRHHNVAVRCRFAA